MRQPCDFFIFVSHALSFPTPGSLKLVITLLEARSTFGFSLGCSLEFAAKSSARPKKSKSLLRLKHPSVRWTRWTKSVCILYRQR